jgi:hypothetical protein
MQSHRRSPRWSAEMWQNTFWYLPMLQIWFLCVLWFLQNNFLRPRTWCHPQSAAPINFVLSLRSVLRQGRQHNTHVYAALQHRTSPGNISSTLALLIPLVIIIKNWNHTDAETSLVRRQSPFFRHKSGVPKWNLITPLFHLFTSD